MGGRSGSVPTRIGGFAAEGHTRREKARGGLNTGARSNDPIHLIGLQAHMPSPDPDPVRTRRKGLWSLVEPLLDPPDLKAAAQFGRATDSAANIDAGQALVQHVAGDTLGAGKHILDVAVELGVGRDEEDAVDAERLVQLVCQSVLAAELQVGAPLGAQRVDPRAPIRGQGLEARFAAKVVAALEAEL